MNIEKLLTICRAEPIFWCEEGVRFAPGRIGMLLRRHWMLRRMSALGKSSMFEMGTLVIGYENISIGEKFAMMRYSRLAASDGVMRIGDRVSINSHVCIDASGGGRISIGDDVLIGPNVVLRASNHVFGEIGRPINQQGHTGGDIVIGEDVWIAANVVVLPNVRVGSHAVVAAGAVVNKDVEP